MRAPRFALVATILAATMFSTDVSARPRFPAIFGAMVGTVGGMMALHHHRHAWAARNHRHHARRTAPATAPATEQPADANAAASPANTAATTNTTAAVQGNTASQPSQANGGANGQAAWTGPLFWPQLADDLVDYVFWPSGKDDRFWTYGYSDLLDGALHPASRADRSASRRSRSQTTAAASGAGGAAGPCVGQQAAQIADAVIARIDEIVQATEAQKATLAELRAAALHGLGYIDTACPTDRPQTPNARLDGMEDRIWAARQALLVTRGPLAKLYASLTDEQKARLNGPNLAAQAGERGTACGQPADLAAAARIEQRVRPSNEQRPGLEAFRMMSAGLARLVAASCPPGTPATPVERLDAADRRLNSLLYAVAALRAPLDGLYGSLSDQQRTKLNASR